MDPLNPLRDYSLSAYDQRNLFVFNGAYQMPWDKRLNGKVAKATLGGWAINGIYLWLWASLDIWTGSIIPRTAIPNRTDRPNLAPGASNNPINGVTAGCQGIPAGQNLQTPKRWFDPCAFTLPPAGFFGNLGRHTVTAPGLFEWTSRW